MTSVTIKNFEQVVDEVSQRLDLCTFIAFDCEFTSLATDRLLEPSLFDSVEQRYQKQRESVSNFLACQVGITLFEKDVVRNVYVGHCYDFYLCPRYYGPDINDGFRMNTNSIDFLCDNAFDFNTMLHEGVPFLTRTQERKIKVQIERREFDRELRRLRSDTLQNIKLRVAQWLNKKAAEARVRMGIDDELRPEPELEADSERISRASLLTFDDLETCVGQRMEIPYRPHSNYYLNYLTIEDVLNTFACIWIHRTDGDTPKLEVRIVSRRERAHMEQGHSRHNIDTLMSNLLGFTIVFRMLADSKKPLVGHNMMYDLLAICNQFHDALPAELAEFKRIVHDLFPTVIDTRVLLNRMPKTGYPSLPQELNHLNLARLYQVLNSQDFVRYAPLQPEVVVSRQDAVEYKPHDAGFDSYITGVVFLRLCHLLAVRRQLEPVQHLILQEAEADGPDALHPIDLMDHPADYYIDDDAIPFPARVPLRNLVQPTWADYMLEVARCTNSVNLARAQVHDLRLDGDERRSDRPPILLISGFSDVPLAAAYDDIQNFGSFDVRQVNERFALLALPSKKMAKDIVTKFNRVWNHCFAIEPYKEVRKRNRSFHWAFTAANITIVSFLTYKLVKWFRR